MELDKIVLGQIVHSRAGRDKEKYFMVVGIISNEYVLISDGDIRRIDKPKKKKIKHIVCHDIVDLDIKNKLESGARVNNAEIKKSLKSKGLTN